MSQRNVPLHQFLPWIYLTLILVATVVAVVGILASHISGEEFNPTTLQRREFKRWRIPFTNLQFTPTYQEPTQPNKLGEFLRDKNWWMPESPDAAMEWQVASELSIRGVVRAEVALLSQLTVDEKFWVEWSRENAGRAADFWPAVAMQVQRRDYLPLPRLFALAVERTDAAAWKERFAEWQAEFARP